MPRQESILETALKHKTALSFEDMLAHFLFFSLKWLSEIICK
jgi:hypothetical protein